MKSCRAVIAAVTMAGIVMGNFSTYARQELMEFKEGLTVMLIGMLFVLLAADVRISSILELGWLRGFCGAGAYFYRTTLAVFAGTHLSNMAAGAAVYVLDWSLGIGGRVPVCGPDERAGVSGG
ncbi:MAG: hypothetical protein R2874_12035 [Desulfobacterales bacterium]